MPNRFFKEEDIQKSTDTRWRGKVAEELRKRNPFGDLHAAAIYNDPQVYLYIKELFSPYGAKLVLEMDEEGLQAGFYIERGYVWAAETGWTLQPHWDWHHFLFLLGNRPDFLAHFQKAKEQHGDFSFWVSSGESDPEELSLYASHLPFSALLGVLQGWPGQLWCNVCFYTHIPAETLLKSDDESVMKALIAALSATEPIYRMVMQRRREIEARGSAFSGSVPTE